MIFDFYYPVHNQKCIAIKNIQLNQPVAGSNPARSTEKALIIFSN